MSLAVPLLCAGPSKAAELQSAAPHLGACGLETGGFRLPGTDGCLQIGGYVRAEAGWRIGSSASAALVTPGGMPRSTATANALSSSAISATGRLSADLRLPTEAGPLRAFVSIRGQRRLTGDRGAP